MVADGNVLQKIIEKTGKTKEQLLQEVQQEYNSLDLTIPEEQRRMTAINKLIASYRKLLAAKGQVVEGIFVGSTSTMDTVATRRKTAMLYYKNNKVEAVKLGITDEDGAPLYHAPTEEIESMPEFMKKRIGTPLPEHEYQKLLVFAFKTKTGYVPATFKVRGENVKRQIPLFTPGKFVAYPLQQSNLDFVRFNDSGSFNFETTGPELNDDQIKDLMNTAFKTHLITLNQLETFAKAHPEFERFAVMKVTITEILPIPLPSGAQIIRVEDDTMELVNAIGDIVPPITCFVNTPDKLTFGERSEVYLIGQPNVNERGSSINVLGIYVPKTYRLKAPLSLPEFDSAGGVKTWG